ncbi:unnamed protein product [Medioppia subpectinata]|uniref:Protein kinase domain-containing protein n=1 Tax=Medioppia subpectinata TaxID=1979941 RepID=A0A7R9KY92_9ACAR|nr:unnamed protein product [Medioppia subpectinata]CAG2111851.1 unnamed protein product [Medioppia subpectinata]
MGGFGEIYLCRRAGDKAEQFVCKVDNYDGPLFAEMNFYIRVAKEDSIGAFKAAQRLKYLGMPRYVANGIHDITSPAGAHNKLNKETAREWKSQAKANRNSPTLQYRFLVMQRFGPELAAAVKKRLTATDAAHIGAKMIDVLHYIHTFGYIHADIKGTNILQALATVSKGKTSAAANSSDYYLVDYGLAERYSDLSGKHKDEVPDRKRANNGTVEYRSRDAHIGLISRRSDVECLAYNVIEWLSGRLPWMDCLANAAKVETMKRDGMKNMDKLLRQCFAGHTVPTGLKEFMQEVNKIGYKSEPNYALLKRILTDKVAKSKAIAANKRAANDDDDEESDEEEDRESDGEDDDDEEVEEERPRRGNRRVGPSNTRAVNKSPPKRKRPATKTTAAKKRISVVELSDSSPESSAGRAKGKSPAKKLRVVANTKSDNHLDAKTPKNKNGRDEFRFSTPLMFSRKEDSFGNPITDSDHSPDRTRDDSQLNGSVASSGGRRAHRNTSYYSPMGGSLSDIETSRRESPIMVKTATAPIVTAVVVETEAMRAVRQKLNIKAQQVLAPPIQTETPQMKEIREMRERKALEATKKTTKKRKC